MDDPSIFYEKVQTLEKDGRYFSAMKEIFKALDKNPNDTAALEVAQLILHLGSGPNAHKAIEPLTHEVINDPRLDKVFCQCDICKRFWIINPILAKAKRVHFINVIGVQCKKCNRVICKDCWKLGDDSYLCPVCSGVTMRITKPNGRDPIQTPKKSGQLTTVIVLRNGPIPPDDKFLDDLFAQISPDVLEDKPRVHAFPLFPWPDSQTKTKSKLIETIAQHGIEITDNNQVFFIEKDNKDYICLAKFYSESGKKLEAWEQYKQYVSIPSNALDSEVRSGMRFVFVFRDGAHMESVVNYIPENLANQLINSITGHGPTTLSGVSGKYKITFEPVKYSLREAKDLMNFVVLRGGEIYEALLR